MPTASIYIRFSAKKQERGDSLRRQTALAQAFAEKHQLTICETYSDLGISAYRGKNAKRGALKRFLEDFKEARITAGHWLIFEDFDRLSRRVINEAFAIFLELINAGIVIGTTAEDKVYSKANIGEFNILLEALLK